MAPDINPWSAEHWDPIAQSNYIRKYGMARAIARANDAGTTVHGAPPIPKYDHKKHSKNVLAIVKRRNALRNANPTVTFAAHFDLGYSQPDFVGNLIDQEIDIILNPGDISFPAHFRLGYEARQVPFGNVVPIWPDRIALGIDESAPPVETPIPQVDFGLGIDESFLFSNTQGLTTNMGLGVSQRQTFGDERDIFDVNMMLGYDANNDIQINTENIPVSMSLGLTEAAAVSRESDIAASALLGLTESAAVEVAYHVAAAFDIGLDETAVEVGAVRYITAAPTLGIDEAATTNYEVSVAAHPSLGITETAFVGRERDIDASMDLGVDETTQLDAALEAASLDLGIEQSTIVDLLTNIISNHSLGVSESASISFEKDLTESLGLGVTQTLPPYGLDLEREPQLSDIRVGLDMFATPSMEYPIGPYSIDPGVDMAATVIRETYQSASPALGITESATVEAFERKLYGEFITSHDSVVAPVSFTVDGGRNSDSRYFAIVISQQAGSGVGDINNVNIGSVGNGDLVKRVNYAGIAQTEIWFGKFTSGNPVAIEYLLPNAVPSTCAVYRIWSAASADVFLMDSGSDTQAGLTDASTTINTEKDTGFVVAGTIDSGSTGFTGPTQLTQDANTGERRFYSGVDTLNVDTFVADVSVSQNKLIAAASFSAFERASLFPAPSIGASMAAILSRTQQNIQGASPALGLSMAANIARGLPQVSPALGLTAAATVTTTTTVNPITNLTMAGNDLTGITANTNTFTLTGKSIGTAPGAGVNRWVVGIWQCAGGAHVFSSATIGGQTAALIAQNTVAGPRIFMVGAKVNSGTTADFTLVSTLSTNTQFVLTWYTMNGDLLTTPLATLRNSNTATFNSQVLNPTAVGGIVLAAIGSALVGGVAYTWSTPVPAWTADVSTATFSTLRQSRRSKIIASGTTQNLGDFSGMSTSNSNVLAVSLNWG